MRKKKEENNYNAILIGTIAIVFIFAVGAHIINSVDNDKLICNSINGSIKMSSVVGLSSEQPMCILENGTIINISDIKLIGLD